MKRLLSEEIPKLVPSKWLKAEKKKGVFTMLGKHLLPAAMPEHINDWWTLQGNEEKLRKTAESGYMLTDNLEMLRGDAIDDDDIEAVQKTM